ncbi:MAG: hypothetical protein KAU36_04040 [candidate division Zixibacteria bacterium]|nr:hypothetical protein [candidate division Zixibacteria bacterium]
MECYFGSRELPHDNQLHKSAVVSFIIPEIGIKFKAPFDAVDSDHSDYASLLALLEFIDSNQKYFSRTTYQIFGNNHNIVNQVNLRQSTPEKFSHLLQKALNYREKYRYSLDWVERNVNPTFDSLLD